MQMQQIRYFLAVARTLNFTRAAEECNVAQPSLSRAIKDLEIELGGDLFRRERALTHITELGALMLPLLSQCLDSALEAKTLAASYKKGVSAPLRLVLSHTISLSLLVPALRELVQALPGLELQFTRGDAKEICQLLKAGGAELGVAGPLGSDWNRLDAWPLFDEGYVLLMSPAHPLAMRNQVDLSELARLRLICRPDSEQAEDLAALLRANGIEHEAGDSAISDHDLMELLEANVGVAIMPQSACGSRELRALAVHGLTMRRTVHLYAVSGRARTPASTGLMKLLRAADWSSSLPFVRPPARTASAAGRRA